MGFPRLPKARGFKLAAILAAAYVGAVLLVLSAGSGLEPILRPLLPSDDQAVDFEVQVRHDPTPPPPPPAREQPVEPATATERVSPPPASHPAAPAKAPEPERTTLVAPPPEAPPAVEPAPAPPPSGEPAEPAPVEEPLPVIEEPTGDSGPAQAPAPIELPPAEAQPEIAKPVEDDQPGGVIELGSPPGKLLR
jgi:hypothetical protein